MTDRPAPLDRLAVLRDELAAKEAEVTALRAERVALYQSLRSEDPPVTFVRIGEAAGVSEVAVMQTLRKEQKRNEAT